MLLYFEYFLLILSLIGCVVFLSFMIKKLCDVVKYSEYSKAHIMPETDPETDDAEKETEPVRASVREGTAHAGWNKRTGLYFGLAKQSKSHPKRNKICAGKQPFTHGTVR